MSENVKTEDPMLLHLRERRRDLHEQIREKQARVSEIEMLMHAMADGRTVVRRKMRAAGSNSAADAADAPSVLVPEPQRPPELQAELGEAG